MSQRRPLPDRLRPDALDGLVGHHDLLRPGGELQGMIARQQLTSMVFWGPPGCGKTTLARVVARSVGARWIPLSAVLDGVPALRKVVDDAKRPALGDTAPPVVFVDEIHRWNKAQQDALLPHVEDGTLILLGATTENPGVSLRPALRSRVRLVHLDPPAQDDIHGLLARAWTLPDGLGRAAPADPEVLAVIARRAGGDVRRALLDLERVAEAIDHGLPVDPGAVATLLGRPDLRHDRDGDSHYDLVSAWIKSMRGSDPDAAIYWLARLIEGGEDPVFLCRRLVIFAAEDVGNADPRALGVATDAAAAVQLVGLPEGRIPLAQATTWLACAPKSDAAYQAINAAIEDVRRTGALPVPPALRGAPAGVRSAEPDHPYRNPHGAPDRIVRQVHRPAAVDGRVYYEPADHGEERVLRQRLDWWRRRLASRDDDGGGVP